MKRALAERASKSSASQTSGVTKSATLLCSSPPPLNKSILSSSSQAPILSCICSNCPCKQKQQQSAALCSSEVPQSQSPQKTKKSKHSHALDLVRVNEDDNSFYLKHQNRALVSNYLTHKELILQLEKERSGRRKDIHEACHTLHNIELVWKNMVFDLFGWLDCVMKELAPDLENSSLSQNDIGNNSSVVPSFITSCEDDPDESLENTIYLLQILQRFLHTLPPTPTTNKNESSTKEKSFSHSCQSLFRRMNYFSSLLSSQPLSTSQVQQKNISSLQQQLEQCQHKKTELCQRLHKISSQSSSVKKWLFRCIAGQCTLEHVTDVFESESFDLDNIHDILEKKENENVIQEEGERSEKQQHQNNDVSNNQNRMQELEIKLKCRDERIQELIKELDVNRNSSVTSNPKNIQSNEEFIKISTQYTTCQRKLLYCETQIRQLTKQCSVEKSNTILYQKQLKELQGKQDRKLQDFITEYGFDCDILTPTKNGCNILTNQNSSFNAKIHDKRTAHLVLQHKYQQVLEELKQLESIKATLKETRKLNDYYQHKMEEFKSKYIAAQTQAKNSKQQQENIINENSSTIQSSSTSSSNSVSYDKLKLDFRKVRKELAAANLSKENYKAKFDKVVQERDALLKANMRLMKQNSEKEEVNTKSLSTILHLKQLSELHVQEKKAIELAQKSAEQLALSARLKANAKERFQEEITQEKMKIEELYKSSKIENESLQKINDENKARLNSHELNVENLKKEIDSLQKQYSTCSSQLKQIKEDKYTLQEQLAMSNNSNNTTSLKEALKQRNQPQVQQNTVNSSGSEFTVDQLSTQVQVLKGRLACPVCNYRDKNCILLRCRHMFCKHCVDENIKNRSRKCPACGQRFDTKDVGDVWL